MAGKPNIVVDDRAAALNSNRQEPTYTVVLNFQNDCSYQSWPLQLSKTPETSSPYSIICKLILLLLVSVDGHMADDQVRTSSKVARGTPKWRSS